MNRVGRYICSIPNTQENKQIEVIARVSMLSTTQDANLCRDGTKLLVCVARAYPNYPSITWMAGNSSSISQRHADVSNDLLDGSYSRQSSITVRTTGNFTCRAEASGERQENIISVAVVRVTSAPVVTTRIVSIGLSKIAFNLMRVLVAFSAYL